MNGLFISFEGIDGAGKSTHISALAQEFQSRGRVVMNTREPGGTALAEKLRMMVLNDRMDALTEALLVFAARRDHLCQVIIPALNRGEVVLCDRFTDASFAYQGGGMGLRSEILRQLELWVQAGDPDSSQLLEPQLTIWFDLPPRVAATRLSLARLPDKFESQNLEFFERVTRAYAQRCSESPGRFARVDANQAMERVAAQVLEVMHSRGFLG
jgi:dTMP kinase